jgi:hypothetical protein
MTAKSKQQQNPSNIKFKIPRCNVDTWGTPFRLRFGEAHGYRIHAVAEAGGRRAVVEDVA